MAESFYATLNVSTDPSFALMHEVRATGETIQVRERRNIEAPMLEDFSKWVDEINALGLEESTIDMEVEDAFEGWPAEVRVMISGWRTVTEEAELEVIRERIEEWKEIANARA